VSAPVATRTASWRAFNAVVLGGFAVLYIATRPVLMISDGASWVFEAANANPVNTWYGFPSYFLQIPLAHWLWSALHALGVPVSVAGVFLFISLAGTLTAVVSVGRIAAILLDSKEAGWIASCLLGAALNPWTQWNGELSGLALGFTAAGLWLVLRGGIGWPAALWALSVMSQVNFVLAAPAFVTAIWLSRPAGDSHGATLRRTVSVTALAGAVCLILFLVGSWAAGKWHAPADLVAWIQGSFRIADKSVGVHPQPLRAIKGLLTSYTAATHIVRDAFAERGILGHSGFLQTAVVAFGLLTMTGVLLASAIRRRRVFAFALAWLLPFHVGFNWWWAPTEEEYHTGALPGLVLLVTAGLISIGAGMSARRRNVLYAGYVAALAGFNLFVVIVPRQQLASDTISVSRQIQQLRDEHGGRLVLVTCDGGNVEAVRRSGLEYLRIRSIWRGPVPDIQSRIVDWVAARLAEGKEPYLLGRWCLPENWKTQWSKAPFDLYFLDTRFRIGPPAIKAIPTDQESATDPFLWGRGDLAPLEKRNASGQ
jgi:hypothetical protein